MPKKKSLLQQPSENVASYPAASKDDDEVPTAKDLDIVETGGPDHQPRTWQKSRFQDFPEEFEHFLIGRVFETEDKLEAVLQELKVED